MKINNFNNSCCLLVCLSVCMSRSSMIIGIGGEKGGCGKTTAATNIAAYLAYKGKDVGILDADPKPAASNWVARRKEQDLPAIACKRAIGDIDAVIKAMGKEHEFTIIDCGGMDSSEMRYAIAYSDIFIAPFMPSVYDTSTAKAIDELVARGKIFNPKLKAFSLIAGASNNRQSTTTKTTRDIKRIFDIISISSMR